MISQTKLPVWKIRARVIIGCEAKDGKWPGVEESPSLIDHWIWSYWGKTTWFPVIRRLHCNQLTPGYDTRALLRPVCRETETNQDGTLSEKILFVAPRHLPLEVPDAEHTDGIMSSSLNTFPSVSLWSRHGFSICFHCLETSRWLMIRTFCNQSRSLQGAGVNSVLAFTCNKHWGLGFQWKYESTNTMKLFQLF